MEFISEDGGESYNLCHCKLLPRPAGRNNVIHVIYRLDQSGPTLRLPILTFGGPTHTWTSILISKRREASGMKDGCVNAQPPSVSVQLSRFSFEQGDAPVHSIAAALFLPKSAIHYWDNIGYRHGVYQVSHMYIPIYSKLLQAALVFL